MPDYDRLLAAVEEKLWKAERERVPKAEMSRNFYLILGVAETATDRDVKRAYRRLARKYHPDINPGDQAAEQHFKRIAEAYGVLSDPDKRGFYDEHGYYDEAIRESRTETRWDFRFRSFDSSSTDGVGQDSFDDFVSHVRPPDELETSEDLECHVSISFEESIRGHETVVDVERKRSCDACRGSGRAAGGRHATCQSCSGSGQLVRAKGHLQFSMTCLRCGGSGRVALACSKCGGDGRVVRSDRVRVELPPGVSSGSRIRIPGEGNRGRERYGDLYVVTNVSEHRYFKRVGDNIQCTVPITVTEAALGAKIEVPTIHGTATLRIPPGIQTGRTLRLRGKGAPSLRGTGVSGDQHVEVRVVVPKVADERSKEILRELAELNPENPREGPNAYAQ